MEAPARGVEAVERCSATRGCQRKQEVAGEAAQSGGRRFAAAATGEEEQAGRLEEGESGPICNFKNFRDLTVNQQ